MKDYRLASPLMTGPEVRVAQARLGVTVDGEYGPVTAGALKVWKHRFGYPANLITQTMHASDLAYLTGAKKQTRLQRLRALHRARVAARNRPLPAKALAEAKKRVGLKESPAGSNVQPTLQALLRSLGARSSYVAMGFAWCDLFVHAMRAAAGDKIAMQALRTGTPYPLYVPQTVADARAGRYGMRLVGWDEAKPGDMVTFDWDDDGVDDHIGFVDHRMNASLIATVEGNTSFGAGGSQSNGGAVAARVRNRSDVAHIIRWA